MLTQLAIQKSGYIEVRGPVKDDRYQCLERGAREFDYTVEIKAKPDALTTEGFILDRHSIPKYFDEKYLRGVDALPSCEKMAQQACEDLVVLCQGRAEMVTVQVGGARCTWIRPDSRLAIGRIA